MIKIFLIVILCLFAFYIIVGRKLAKNIKASSERKYKQEQQRAAWRDGYQAEKIKIAIEQGRAAARAEELQPTLDLRQIDGIQKKRAAIINEDTSKKGELKFATKKKPICEEHNFEGKNWLDYARHIRKYHKIKK
jgi:hypothetical protein